MGIRIGDIECPGSRCADDVGVQAYSQEEAQVLTNMASDFAGKQFYEMQADKSATVVTPHGRSSDGQQVSIMMDNAEIPVVESSTHIGLKRSSGFNDTITDTVNQNITNARRTIYSLLSTGLHGENGLDVETSLHLLKIYVLPVLLYGLEITSPFGYLFFLHFNIRNMKQAGFKLYKLLGYRSDCDLLTFHIVDFRSVVGFCDF